MRMRRVVMQTLSRFALTHEEIVARRRMLPRGYDSQRSAGALVVSVNPLRSLLLIVNLCM